MAQLGNKQNAIFNLEWGTHVKKWMKQLTAHRRRNAGKKEITNQLKD